MQPSILWDVHSSGYQVPGLPVRGRTGDKKGGGGETQDRARTNLTAPGITAVRRQESGDPQELLKRVLVYMYLYNSRG